MNFLMSQIILFSVPSDELPQVSLAFAHPDAPIICSEDLQYSMCFSRVVKPLENLCIEEGFEPEHCYKRSMKWLIKQRVKMMQ